MNESLRKLNMLVKSGAIDPDDFYSIIVHAYNVQLQGHYTPGRAIRYARFNPNVGCHGYLVGKRYNIELTLT